MPGARPRAARRAGRRARALGDARGPPPGRPGRGELLGTLKKHRDGFGFVARLDRKGDDVFVPPDEAARALDGDLVRSRSSRRAAGARPGGSWRWSSAGAGCSSAPTTPAGPRTLRGPGRRRAGRRRAGAGDRRRRGRRRREGRARARHRARSRGRVVEAIGRPGEPRVEVLKVAYAKGFADVFPEAVAGRGAEATPDHVRTEDWRGRRDLTAPAARHHRRRGRARLRRRGPRGAARAPEGQAALPARRRHRRRGALRPAGHRRSTPRPARRATSVYFPMQVLPMLPGAALERHLLAQPGRWTASAWWPTW